MVAIQPIPPTNLIATFSCWYQEFGKSVLLNNSSTSNNNNKLVVKVIWHQAASRHGRFNRIHQVAPMCTPSIAPQLASAPYRCWPLLSCFECIDRQTGPEMSRAGPLSPSKLSLHVRGSGPHLIYGSLGPTESKSQTASRSVQPFWRADGRYRQLDRPTDRPTDDSTPSVAIGRI